MAAWKDLERRVAKLLGGTRTGCTGEATADVLVGNWLAVECKYKAKLPLWLAGALAQVRGCAGDARLPIVVLFERGRKTGDSLVLMTLTDFEQWFGDRDGHNDGE
jgi:hypothetical protein